MKKTLLSALVVIALTVQLVGCNGNTPVEQPSDSSSSVSDVSEPQNSTSSSTDISSSGGNSSSSTTSSSSSTTTSSSSSSSESASVSDNNIGSSSTGNGSTGSDNSSSTGNSNNSLNGTASGSNSTTSGSSSSSNNTSEPKENSDAETTDKALRDRAKAAYEADKDLLDCDEDTYVEMYVNYVEWGYYEPTVSMTLLYEFAKNPPDIRENTGGNSGSDDINYTPAPGTYGTGDYLGIKARELTGEWVDTAGGHFWKEGDKYYRTKYDAAYIVSDVPYNQVFADVNYTPAPGTKGTGEYNGCTARELTGEWVDTSTGHYWKEGRNYYRSKEDAAYRCNSVTKDEADPEEAMKEWQEWLESGGKIPFFQ